ncbi:MAG: GtrA family protein [Minisyncoccia bacterium]|jgi:putative flippase GtrA
MKGEIKKFFKYGIGGGWAFLVTFALTYLLTEKIHLFYLISAIIGYLSGFLINFTFQAFITFKTKTELYFRRFLKFCFFQIIGLVFYSLLLAFFTEVLNIYYLYSLILSSGLTYILNFYLAKTFVFN